VESGKGHGIEDDAGTQRLTAAAESEFSLLFSPN
jgi:hypothetical protein